MPNKLWVEQYRPKTIDDYVFQNESHKNKFKKYIEEQSIPNLLLKGYRGTGKTSLAFILKSELNVEDGDFKMLNASDDNSIQNIRNEIKSFMQTMPLGDFKIVFLDEADYLSIAAQAALRGMMESHTETVRFILTCNKPHKIIDELRSRCQEFTFDTFSKEEMAVYAYKIMKKEGVKVRDAELIKSYVEDCYPDLRKLLQNLELNTVNGELQDPIEIDDMDKTLIDIVEQLNKGKWLEVRQSIVQNVEDHEWDEIYRFLYDNLEDIEGFNDTNNWKKGIIIIADHLRFHHQVADPEINFSSCMVKLSNIIKE